MSELSIKVTIAGRTYPLTIKREEEEVIRKAATNINSSVKALQDNYAVRDTQDLLAMTALQLATQLSTDRGDVQNDKLAQELSEMETQIADYLNK